MIKDNLSNLLDIDPNSQTKEFKKKETLQRAGKMSSKAFFVKKGLLRSYIIDNKGKEHIFMFASEGWLIADIESQEFNQPTELFIDALEDSEVVIFNRECFTVASLDEGQLKENARLMARRIAVLQRRVILLMSASAKERYNRFLETYPGLANRIPQRMIASYLGITPQALSTIRSKLHKS